MTTIDLFTDLEVLGMLKHDSKICIRDGRISIERKSHPITQALRRWANNDGRRMTIMQINSIINQSLQLCKESKDKPWVISQFHKHFNSVLAGLENMKKTYADDSAVVARLNVISALLKEEIKEIESLPHGQDSVSQ
jgi:hypothetical protein